MALINLGKESSQRGILCLLKGRRSSSSLCLATSTYRCGKRRELGKWSEAPQRPPGRRLADSPRNAGRRRPSSLSALAGSKVPLRVALKQRLQKIRQIHAFHYWTYFGDSPGPQRPPPLEKPPIKGGLGGRQDPMSSLGKQKELDAPSLYLWPLKPWAGQWSPAPKTLALQQVTHVEEWLETVQDVSGESQQGQHILQTILAGRWLSHFQPPECPDSCTSSKPGPPATHQFWDALISCPINSPFD